MKNLFSTIIVFCFLLPGFATEKKTNSSIDDMLQYDLCVDVTFSCGHEGTVCGSDLEDVIEWTLIWDNEICG